MHSNERIDMTACNYCGDPDEPLTVYHGVALCDSCEEMERTTDWDKFEADKRQRIAEASEY